MVARVTSMYMPGLRYNAEQERGKLWNKHMSFSNVAVQIHMLFIFPLTEASSPFPPRTALHLPHR